MIASPTTSITLLNTISSDLQSVRWTEFVQKYEPSLRDFLQRRFPGVPEDDILQETFLAVTKNLSGYQYQPDEKGHFRNYLTGILRHKAMQYLERKNRENSSIRMYRCENPQPEDDEETAFRESVYELALQELLADKDINPRTKQIFIRVSVNGEKPEDVAAAFGVTRNSVDQIKSRMMVKLRAAIERLYFEE